MDLDNQTKKNKLIDMVIDQNLIDFFYLNFTTEQVLEKLQNLKFEFLKECSAVPFNACVKGYGGANDSDGNLWIIKKCEQKDIFNIRLCELGYLIDFELQTLSAPSALIKIGSDYYRASKVVHNAEGVSGYDYLTGSILRILFNDLINRWLVFDEDRNPNNYLVIQNSKRQPIIVAIDNGNQDLEAENMKITGNDKQFGWFRMEKTRFLTLLRPSHFENVSLEDIEERLDLLMGFSEERFRNICRRLFENLIPEHEEKVNLITSNFLKRRTYINDYFRTWFKEKDQKAVENKDSEYQLFGETLMKMYKN